MREISQQCRQRKAGNDRILQLIIYFFLFTSLIAGSGYAESLSSLKSGNWSDRSIWSGGKIPGQGDAVRIDSGHVVVYDVNSDAEIRTLHIRGTLTFSRAKHTRLDVGMIIISGSSHIDFNANCSQHHSGQIWSNAPRPALEVGTLDDPIPEGITATINLVYFSGLDPDCAPGIITYGGRMDFHGAPLNRTWVKLAASAPKGAQTIKITEPVNWKAGDHIIITRSQRPPGNSVSFGTYRTNGLQQTEERIISSITGTTLTLDRPLSVDHPRYKEKYAAEVANLSRNVVIRSKDPGGHRGHTMYHFNSRGSISYAEFAHLGKANTLARYPIHFHLLRNSMRGSSVVGASIWDSANRFITIHGTDYMVIRDCVGYKSRGHGYFMEDASEVYNLLENNLAVLTYNVDPLPDQFLDFDPNDGAGYWWANGRNAFVNNVASETDDYGFRFEIPEEFTGPVVQPDGTMQTDVRINSLSFLLFKGNEIHGTLKYGYRGDGNPSIDDPLVIEDLSIWACWYAFRPDMRNFYIKNLDVWNTAYGFYGRSPGNGRVEGYTAINPGNYIMGFQEAPEGLITFENVVGDSVNEYPFRIYGQDPRDEPCEIHVRNYTVTHVDEGYNGARSKDPEPHPPLTLYLHDFFGPGSDAKVIPANQNPSDGLSYSSMSPQFDGVKVARVDVPFPENPIHVEDRLPPATVITYPANGQIFSDQTGAITVSGTCIDASPITTLRVNGVPVTPLAENFRHWQVTLRDIASERELVIQTEAVDARGNRELTPHKIRVGIGIVPTGTSDDPVEDPIAARDFQLFNNYPNPFNPETRIKFNVSRISNEASQVRLTIYNALGHKIRELVNQQMAPGTHEVLWNGRDETGQNVASGVYIYEMIARSPQTQRIFRQAKKMLLMR